jgi:ribulose-5-phosphate 4-epimerase/fuculose-1-phosphate aldolase
MENLDSVIGDLVIANRILAHEGVLDAYGHVSVRHPVHKDRYLLSCSRAPELVEKHDIAEYHLSGEPVHKNDHRPYLERFIHGAIYEARPDVLAVIHSHAEDTLPFGMTKEPLRPVIHNASRMGSHVSVWDIRDTFGDTNMLVSNVAQGRDLAKSLGKDSVVLMRGHGFAAAGGNLLEAVGLSVYLPKNARVLFNALRFGGIVGLSPGEIDQIHNGPQAHDWKRAWEYWSRRAGFGGKSDS